jgi:hypothetical protein
MTTGKRPALNKTAAAIHNVFLVVFLLVTLTLAAVSPAFSRAAEDESAPPADAGQPGPQSVPASNPSGGPGPGAAAGGAGNQNQSPIVNPLTGLVSASASDYHPATGRERRQLYWRQNFASVGAYVGPFVAALALDQATGNPEEWGGGFTGFGRRLASRTAVAIVQGTLQAAGAAALHEDVRYISSSQTGFKKRTLHAIAFSFLTYDNRGRTTLNVANLSSYYASAAISMAWMPGRNNVALRTFTDGTEQMGFSVPVNLLQEFWPEISHKILRRP